MSNRASLAGPRRFLEAQEEDPAHHNVLEEGNWEIEKAPAITCLTLLLFQQPLSAV